MFERLDGNQFTMTKAFGILLVIIACLLFMPFAVGIVGGVFGAVLGVLGAVFGAIFGLIGGLFGAIFGVFGWIFDGLFNWDWPFGFFYCNPLTLAIIIIVAVLIVKNQRKTAK